MHLPHWPTIALQTTSEQVALDFVAAVEAELGPLPQAELIEPWDAGEAWRVRIDLPDLTLEQAGRLVALHPDAALESGLRTGARAARDQGAVVPDRLGPAVLWSDAVEGGLCLPDLDEEAAEPAGGALASELVAAVRGVSAELVPDPADAITFVRHRPTGRRGVRLQVPDAALASLEGQALLALRLDVVHAIAGVVERHGSELAPDLVWDPRLGLSVIAWRIGPPGPSLMGDASVEPGLTPPLEHLAALDLGERVHALELQVVAEASADADAVAMACAGRLEGAPVVGAEPRWVRARAVDGSTRSALAACWRVPAADLADLAAHLEHLLELDGVVAVRIVPAEPVGLEDIAGYLDPAWHWTGGRWVVRWRDGVRDRDRLVAWVTRDVDRQDGSALRALQQGLARVPGIRLLEDGDGRLVRPIIDDQGRAGLGLHLAPELATDPLRLGWLLSALGGVPLPGWSDVVDLALPVDGVVLHLWRRPATKTEAQPPVWVSVG